MKEFLKTNIFTRHLYAALFYWKYNGLKKTIQKIIAKCFGLHFGPSMVSQFERTYKIPVILRNSKGNKTVEIISCAFRKHEPEKGLTGGPNGVLATEKDIFGPMYHGMSMKYIFWTYDVKYPKHLEAELEGVSFMVKINFYAAYYLQYRTTIWDGWSSGKDFLFICHDIGFAYGAYLAGAKYNLVYHTQGSLVNERESFGEILSERDKELANKLEEAVFYHAEKVYFPSVGAKESFIATTKIDTSKVNFAEEALYNTIQDMPENLDEKELLRPLELKQIDHNITDVFLSVGDFSENKGMERVPIILNEYVKATGRKVYWIGIGSKHKAGIFDKLLQEKEGWSFEATLFGERVDHDTLLSLMEQTDYYIMLQRHSIFDLSTLEAMRAGKGLVLSKLGGNIEVNKENNVILVEMDNIMPSIERLSTVNKFELGKKNKDVFERYFSKQNFFDSYSKMFDEQLNAMGICYNLDSQLNQESISKWKGYFTGKTAIICGSGSSLDDCSPQEGNVYIALNRALFYEKLKFDFLFMQDMPQNQPYTLEDYNNYACIKFYSKITNVMTKTMGFSDVEEIIANVNDVVRYELAPTWFDYRIDLLNFDIDNKCFVDAQSVLFSAIQFAVFAGFSEILLYGVEFSEKNYGNNENPNRYNAFVIKNLMRFKYEITKKYPQVRFTFGSTSNQELISAFEEIENDLDFRG